MSTESFEERVRDALATPDMTGAVWEATTALDARRRAAWGELPDIDALRDLAARIKDHTLEHLGAYLDEFVARLEDGGANVHFASTAAEAVETVAEIARSAGCRRAVKGKSMVSEEIDLNAALAAAGVEVVESDLGEFVVQIENDHPSHIVLPIIHKDIETISRAFERELGVDYTEDEQQLTRAAREHLRPIFRRADLGISGVNFGVASTGTLVLVTNEGNGRYVTSLPRVHVAVMGIEKLIPRLDDVAVFVKLLGRSATGQALTVYTNLVTGPKRSDDADGPEELHVVLLDRGRSALLGTPFSEALRCIRCGACLNACPVYRTIGGHAYGSVYPGPIGKVITPLLEGEKDRAALPEASSLCGGCLEACPVKIDIPRLLVELRARSAGLGAGSRGKRALVRAALSAMRSPRLYRAAQRMLRWSLGLGSRGGWTKARSIRRWTRVERDFPVPPAKSFRAIWRESSK